MAKILDKAMDNYDELTRPELFQLLSGMSRIFRVWEEAYFLFEAGRLDSRTWRSMVNQFAGYLSTPPFSKSWELRKEYFDEEFQQFVGKLERTGYKFG